MSEGRLGRGEAGDWAKPSSDSRHSPGFQEVQQPGAVGALQTRPGPLQCHRRRDPS